MLYLSFSPVLRRILSIFALLGMLFVLCIPQVFATPTSPAATQPMGWIDLSATVPDGFRGSVEVHVKNKADDTFYRVESFVLNDFKNSAQAPQGNYAVEVVTTSEDPFLYDVSCNTQEFTLTDSVALHVTVKKNTAGEAFLASDIKVPDTSPKEPSIESVLSEIETAIEESDTEEIEDETETEEQSVQEEEVSAEVPEEEPEPEAPSRSFWQDMLIRIVGILIFAGIFFGIYYISRRLH